MNTLALLTLVAIGGKGDGPSANWDFKADPLGKLPAGWVAAQTGKGEGSVWKVVEAKDAPGGAGKALAQTAAGPSAMFNLCVADKPKFKDVDLSVSFRAVAGEIDQGGGPVWRYQDNLNYYVARFNPLEENFRLYKVVAGSRLQLATKSVKAEDKHWYTIRVVHKGKSIQCYLNGKLYLEAMDDTLAEAGRIGLWTKADAQTHFTGITVKSVDR